MAKLVTLKRQSGEAVYPVTVTAAVMDSNGNPAEVVFAKKQDSVSSKSSDQGVEVELSGTLASPTVKVNVTSSGITSDNNSVAIASDVYKYAAKNEVFKGAKAETSTSVAEAGKVGLVPAPASGATTKYLRSDGNWSDITSLSGLSATDLMSFVFNDREIFNNKASIRYIPKDTDINTIFGEGKCGFWSAFDNTEYTNAPITNFGLMVNRINSLYFSQMMFGHGGKHVYYRAQYLKSSSGIIWSDWSCFVLGDNTIKTTYDTDKGIKVALSGTFDEPKIDVTTTFGDVAISNSSNAVSGETIAKNVPLLVGKNGTEILANSDLNSVDFCVVGTYSCVSDANAKTLKNCPTTQAFAMFVSAPGYNTPASSPWAYFTRRIVTFSGMEWIQHVYSPVANAPVFEKWYRILREDTTFTKATTSTANGTQVVKAGTGGAVPAPQTVADNDKFLRGNGTWSAIPTSSVGSGITLPATGNAVHEALTGTTYINTIGTDFIDNLFTAKG